AVAWALETATLCADEALLDPAPYASRAAWCAERCRLTEARLAEAAADGSELILVNHWPLRRDLALLPAAPRFVVWCGTRRTEDWHRRFRARTVVYGHLHIPKTTVVDGVRFEEVSFGYPRNWQGRRTLEEALRMILP
ncbi:MAG TPA: metallophosphoesterase, partial [Thermoanaerobaculia bacterium]|nr:metallophosphoesterase [Thermoanaerobaculia bacterium]